MRSASKWCRTAPSTVVKFRVQDFRHLKCWQRAHALAIALHKLSRRFTRGGYARLRAQLTGAADSIGDNIVEGCGARTRKDFAKFLDDSIKLQ